MPTPTSLPPLTELLDRTGDLRKQFTDWMDTPQWSNRKRAYIREREIVIDDEFLLSVVLEEFVRDWRSGRGQSATSQFLAAHPALDDLDRELVSTWTDARLGVFEITGRHGDGLHTRNLVDDLDYPLYSNLGPSGLQGFPENGFLWSMVAPVHPATAEWMLIGSTCAYPRKDAKLAAEIAMQLLMAAPHTLARNSDLWERSWQMQREDRERFIAEVGGPVTILPAEDAAALLEHLTLQSPEGAELPMTAKQRRQHRRSAAQMRASSLEAFGDSEAVALVYDETEGLWMNPNIGDLIDFYETPAALKRAPARRELVEWLEGDIPLLLLDHLAEVYPDTVDEVWRLGLKQPTFSWSSDGERFLARHRTARPAPPVPQRLATGPRLSELLRG